jgi:hypothetical protein
MDVRTSACQSCTRPEAIGSLRRKEIVDENGDSKVVWICRECDEADPEEVGLSELEAQALSRIRFAGGW